jgi:hypothetical protein
MPWIPRHQYDELLKTLDGVTDKIQTLGKRLTERQQEVDQLRLELAVAHADATRAFAKGYDAGHAAAASVVIKANEQDTCQYSYFGCTGLGYWQEDPYAAEIHGDHRVVLACDSCTRARAEDI